MKKIILFLILLLAGVGLFIEIAKVIGWEEIKEGFLDFTGWQAVVILGLTLLMAVIGTWKWKDILKSRGIEIPFRGLFKPYLLGFSMMYLFPMIVFGGEVFRSYFLKRKNDVPWSKGMASVVIDRILEWTVNLVVIFFGLGFFLFKIGSPPRNLAVILGVTFLFFIIAISFFYFKTFKKQSVVKNLLKVNNGQAVEMEKEIFDYFKLNKLPVWKGLMFSFLRGGVMLLRTWLLVLFLVKGLSFLPALSLLGFSYLAVMIPIPASLGSHELIQIFAFNSFGLKTGVAAAFTMTIRGAELIIALTGIIVLFHAGLELLKNTLFKNNRR